jgi:hypothetical protein
MRGWDGDAYDAHLDNYGDPGYTENCREPVDDPDDIEPCGHPWADIEMIDVRYPYPLWVYQSHGEHDLFPGS